MIYHLGHLDSIYIWCLSLGLILNQSYRRTGSSISVIDTNNRHLILTILVVCYDHRGSRYVPTVCTWCWQESNISCGPAVMLFRNLSSGVQQKTTRTFRLMIISCSGESHLTAGGAFVEVSIIVVFSSSLPHLRFSSKALLYHWVLSVQISRSSRMSEDTIMSTQGVCKYAGTAHV